ncbi:MAG: (d)CMP kinase [Candidatus Neomarinimicrobiota bacterium]
MSVVVAIDGPAASGKTTTARMVAGRLDYVHLDTGAMYRAVTLACLDREVAPEVSPALRELLNGLQVRFESAGQGQRTLLNGEDVTEAIRSLEVSRQVSAYSALGEVRSRLVRLQRRIGERHDVVCEGRDIGTIVFPAARFKFYLVADLETRARRRYDELRARGLQPSRENILEELRARDRDDSTRALSPLLKAEDAMTVDTTDLTIAEQADRVAGLVEAALRRDADIRNNKEEEARHE